MTTETDVIERVDAVTLLQRPKMYCVVLHNDDTTTFDFVRAVLMQIFHHTAESAMEIVLQIHNGQRGVAGGPYTHEVAEEKQRETVLFARANGFALVATVEEV